MTGIPKQLINISSGIIPAGVTRAPVTRSRRFLKATVGHGKGGNKQHLFGDPEKEIRVVGLHTGQAVGAGWGGGQIGLKPLLVLLHPQVNTLHQRV